MRRYAPLAMFAVCTVGMATYGSLVTGRATGAAVFLGASAGTLALCVLLLARAARSLLVEPPEVEIAVATGRRRKELEREKASLLKALKELEFDHEMRKVSDADFAEISGAYRARAIRVLRQLDDRQVDYTRLVEEELTRQKRQQATGDRRQATGDGEASAGDLSSFDGKCSGCGTLNDRDAVYCKKCARRLAADEAVT